MRNTTAGIKAEIAKGVFRPHTALTNMALAYYQNASNYFAKALFPTCPVGLSSDNYYIFSREDLLRDNWQRKPAYGKVDPTTIGESTDNYVCKVDQMIMGIDQIRQTDLSRRQGPSIIQPKQQRTRTIAEQANIHQDRLFAASYFKEGAWKNELEGVDNTTPSTNQFIKFSNANSDPIAFIDKEKTDMNQQTGRTPNRLGLGINVFNALKVHPGIENLTERSYQNRAIGLIENGSWAPAAARIMQGMFEKSKNITWLENNVKITSSLSEANEAEIEAMAEELCK